MTFLPVNDRLKHFFLLKNSFLQQPSEQVSERATSFLRRFFRILCVTSCRKTSFFFFFWSNKPSNCRKPLFSPSSNHPIHRFKMSVRTLGRALTLARKASRATGSDCLCSWYSAWDRIWPTAIVLMNFCSMLIVSIDENREKGAGNWPVLKTDQQKQKLFSQTRSYKQNYRQS